MKNDKKKQKDTVVVYWSSANYRADRESWSLLYSEPVSLASEIRKERNTSGARYQMCTAAKDIFHNVFVFKSAIDDKVVISKEALEQAEQELISRPQGVPIQIEEISKVGVSAARPTSFEGYSNVIYNMGWVLFADEPVVAKFTAPYYPPTAPTDDARLSAGKFDIGRWFRPFKLDYHIPTRDTELIFTDNKPMFFVELETDKKVVFKRFIMTAVIENLYLEMSESTLRYAAHMPLARRYEMAKKSKIAEQVLHEIKKNTVE